MTYASGRHFLQIPGPTNVPDRVLRAMAAPTIDHRGPEFGVLGREVLAELKPIFKTQATRSSSIRRRARALGKRRSSIRCRRATQC